MTAMLRLRQTPSPPSASLAAVDSANTEAFFIADTSPTIVYGDGTVSQWTAGYAAQRDGYDQTLHVVHERERIGVEIAATSLTLLIPSYANCTATITLNNSAPIPACAGLSEDGDIPFSLHNLPKGTHAVSWDSGPVGADTQVIFWGINGERPTSGGRNVTLDDSYRSAGPGVVLEYKGDWKEATGDEYLNRTLAVSTQSGASVSFNGTGSAIYLYGTIGPDHGSASLSLNGAVVQPKMNLTSPWTIPYQLLWAGTGYDPLTPLNVEMINLEDKRMTLDFLVLTTDETTLSSLRTVADKSPEFLSTLAGRLVVFALIPLVLCTALATALYLCIRRRKREQARHSWHSAVHITSRACPSRTDEKRDSITWSDGPSVSDVFVSYDQGREQRLSDRWAISPSSTSMSARGRSISPYNATTAVASVKTLAALPEGQSVRGSPISEESTGGSWSRPLRSLLGSDYVRSEHSPRRETNLPPYTPGANGTYLSTASGDAAVAMGTSGRSGVSATPGVSELRLDIGGGNYTTAEAEKALLYALAHAGPNVDQQVESEVVGQSSRRRAEPHHAHPHRTLASSQDRTSTVAPSDVLSIFGQPPSERRDTAMTAFSHLHHMFVPASASSIPSISAQPGVWAEGDVESAPRTKDGEGPRRTFDPFADEHRRSPGGTSASAVVEEERSLRGVSVVSGLSGRSAARPDSDVIPFDAFMGGQGGHR